MSTIKVFNPAGDAASEMSVADGTLVLDRGAQAVKDTVVAIMNGWRAGTASTKTKAEVSGSGKKPFKQKGTGRARAGTTRNPVWRGGGVAFGPKPRDYSVKVNKKVARLAFQRALSDKIASGDLLVVEKFEVAEPKTKLVAPILKKMGIERTCLIVVSTDATCGDANDNFFYGVGNIPNVFVCSSAEVNVYLLCRFAKIVATKEAMNELLERLPQAASEEEMA